MSDKSMRIGQVCDLLRDEFPDISISKLRFLQDKGIIDPPRTPGGYRMYREEEVEALRAALRMQRDEFMPLKVIRDELQRRVREGRPVDAPVVGGRRRQLSNIPGAGEIRLGGEPQMVTEAAAIRAAGVTPAFLDECVAADVIVPHNDADGVVLLSTDDVGLLQLAFRLAKVGIDVRHLRQSVNAMGRQGALIEQFAAALLRSQNPDSRMKAMQRLEELTSLVADFLHIAFIRDVKQSTERATAAGSGARRNANNIQGSTATLL